MKRAFTLIELSIVLIIVGLLVGGVLVGRDLIRAAELQAVATELQQFETAIRVFKSKYSELPGDMPNATDFWGEMGDAAAGSCPSTPGTGTETCDGNGDGFNTSSGAFGNERFLIWQHLANAGLVSGSYTGVSGSGNGYTATAENSYNSKLANGFWSAIFQTPSSGAATMFDGDYGHIIYLGLARADNTATGPILTPAEAFTLDAKIDDGKPATGNMMARCSGGFGICVNTGDSSNLDADYNIGLTGLGVSPIFLNVF